MSFPDKFYLYNGEELLYECEWWVLPRLIDALEREYQSYIDNEAIKVLEQVLADMKHKQNTSNLMQKIQELKKVVAGTNSAMNKCNQDVTITTKARETK